VELLANPKKLQKSARSVVSLGVSYYPGEHPDHSEGGGRVAREFPRLRFGGAHLADESQRDGDVAKRALVGGLTGSFIGLILFFAASKALRLSTPSPLQGEGGGEGRNIVGSHSLSLTLIELLAIRLGRQNTAAKSLVISRKRERGWNSGKVNASMFIATLIIATLIGAIANLATAYHVLGTDKVGQDVLYLSLKSIRTGLIIGTVTTLVTLPLALFLGVAAGYFRGWVDDVIQYIYTVLSSIPSVLLIAAAVLMMQVTIDTHPEWFDTSAARADLRLVFLCLILGVTSWTSLCRLLRGETLKLREMEYIQAAQSFGVSSMRILTRHIMPNVMHIVLISVVMDFSALVLAEAVLSYVGVGVDPTMISFGTMINAARLEMGREPMVWWALASAFCFMLLLVLAANLFADAVRDAFDPRLNRTGA